MNYILNAVQPRQSLFPKLFRQPRQTDSLCNAFTQQILAKHLLSSQAVSGGTQAQNSPLGG